MKKSIHKIDLEMLGTSLRLESDLTEFIDFLNNYIGVLVKKCIGSSPDIIVQLRSDNTLPMETNSNKVSRSLHLKDHGAILLGFGRAHNLNFEVTIKENKLRINAFLEEKKINRFLKPLIILNTYKKETILNFILLTYYLVYIPCFYYLEHFKNLQLLSASAVKYKQNGVIFAGLGGIGKTTFALQSLRILDGCKIISDNFLFHDEERVLALPGPTALDLNSLNLLGTFQKFLTPMINISTHHDRKYYGIEPNLFADSAVPKYIFWLQMGNTNSIEPLNKSFFAQQLLSMNLLTEYIREYFVFAAAVDLASYDNISKNDSFKELSSFLAHIDCFTLTYKPHSDINTIFNETINQVIG